MDSLSKRLRLEAGIIEREYRATEPGVWSDFLEWLRPLNQQRQVRKLRGWAAEAELLEQKVYLWNPDDWPHERKEPNDGKR